MKCARTHSKSLKSTVLTPSSSLIVGIAYEVDCRMITIKEGADVDIGANPSAEEGGEDLEDGTKTVNNVVYSFRLCETSFDKKAFMVYVKGYMKKLKAYLQETNPGTYLLLHFI
jgi:hypothetical protein